MKKIECIIMDWAGTAVDYGCFAPLNAFLKVFAEEKRNSLKNELDSIKERLSIDISSEIEKTIEKLSSFNIQ